MDVSDYIELTKEKIIPVFQALNERSQLETMGKSLNLEQALAIIDFCALEKAKYLWKLSPLLVGMPHEVFTHLLLSVSKESFNLLKQEGVAEPLQHHLTLLSHSLSRQLTEIGFSLELLDNNIHLLDANAHSQDQILMVNQAITQIKSYLHELAHTSSKALEIAWNTSRIDIIESLSHIKETIQRYALSIVGEPRKSDSEPTGLYAKVEEQLARVFGNAHDPNDIEAFNDHEPAIEAIVKFSIWYLQDYWEIGLLPAITRASELDPLELRHDEQARTEFHAKLFHEVQENLQKIGLKTVGDLKKAKIFSKKALIAYIAAHQ